MIQKVILEKGFSEAQFNRVHTPIGIPIKCKSPAEIAVSVALLLYLPVVAYE